MPYQAGVPIPISANTYEKIYASALKLLYPYTPEKTYTVIVKEALKLVGAKYGSLFLVQDGDIKRVYTTDPALNTVIPRKRGNTWKAYTEQKPYLLEISKVNKSHPELSNYRIGSDLGIPLAYNDKVFGVLSVLSHEHLIFSKSDLMTLQLYGPLASLTLRNTQLYAAVTDALQEQDLFISMAAHELKTPLTSVSAYAQLLLNDNAHPRYSSRTMKEKMLHEIQRLSKLVNELLQVSQIKKGRLEYSMKKCNIKEVVERTVANYQNADPAHTTKFICNETAPIYIKGDADKMTQVINNLLTNAAKFSPKDTTIEIRLSKDTNLIKISVRDHGIGISEKDKARIFEGFFKVSLHKKEGLGLGLFLVKNIVDYHKGSISVKSQPNQGTTFIIYLPLYAKW